MVRDTIPDNPETAQSTAQDIIQTTQIAVQRTIMISERLSIETIFVMLQDSCRQEDPETQNGISYPAYIIIRADTTIPLCSR